VLARSDAVWAAWLALFLVLELTAFFGVAPWTTLSQTSWLNEREYPILRTILFGFLIGLAVHIRFQTGLWRTTLGGTVIALVLNYLWS
jgi:surface polysaccharide O-acyltransferase-like enzyme